MAEKDFSWKPLIKGSTHEVHIDDALPDVIIVTLKHETSSYQGALFHIDKENLCYGVRGKLSSMRNLNMCGKKEQILLVNPVAPEERNDLSGLMGRYSYTLDQDAVDPNLLSSPKKDISRPLINKSINKMRLRPRQVMCSVCKKGMNAKNSEKNTLERKEIKTPQDCSTVLVQSTKRKHGGSSEHPFQKQVKSSPAIKISFASPKGVGTVLKIPPRPSTPAPSDSELSQDNSENTESPSHRQQKDYATVSKAGKRERFRKNEGTAPSALHRERFRKNEGTAPSALHRERKHKMKRKETKVPKSKKIQKPKFSLSRKDEMNNLAKHDNAKSSQKTVISKQLSPPIEGHPPLKCKVVLEKLDRHSFSNSSCSSNVTNCDSNESVKYKSRRFAGKTMSQNSDECQENRDRGQSRTETEFNYRDYFEDITDSDDSTSLQIDESDGKLSVNDENTAPPKPLTMKIQTRKVVKIELEDGRSFHEGDVIWGKIVGFPWWPGQITAIYESMKDLGVIIAQNAHISWFGSKTVSVKPCVDLYPFLQYYKDKFCKKKRGAYKLAIKQAKCLVHSTNEVSPAGNNTPTSQESEMNSFCGESEETLMAVTSTISNDTIDLLDSTHEPAGDSSLVQVPDSMPASLPCEGSQEVPNETIDIIQHASSEHHSEIYEDDVNFEIDESNCVAPSEVFRNIHFHSHEKHLDDQSDLEDGEVFSDSN